MLALKALMEIANPPEARQCDAFVRYCEYKQAVKHRLTRSFPSADT